MIAAALAAALSFGVALSAAAPASAAAEFVDGQGVRYLLDDSTKTATVVGVDDRGALPANVVVLDDVIDGGETYTVTGIGDRAFEFASGLTSIELPETITAIGDLAFHDAAALHDLTLPASLVSIGSSAFSGATGLTSVRFPSSLVSIGEGAFYGDAALTAVDFPSDSALTTIHDAAFARAGVETVDLPASLTHIGNSAFENTPLRALEVPASVDEIGSFAFANTPQLSAVRFAPGSRLEILSEAVFAGAANLVSVTLPDTLRTIGASAFEGAFASQDPSTRTSAPAPLTIPASVETVGAYAFYRANLLTDVIVPADSRITTIGEAAFAETSSMTSFTLPSSLRTLEHSVFERSGLREVTIPASVESIGTYAFLDTPLSSVTFAEPSALKSIEERAFSGLDELRSIVLPASLEDVATHAFQYSPNLATVTFKGNAPTVTGAGVDGSFGTGEGLTIRFPDTADGFDLVAGTWMGYDAKALHTVTFQPGNGQPETSATVVDGEIVDKPATDPTRPGYSFVGWTTGTDQQPYDFGAPVVQSLTVSARWSAQTATLEYSANAASGSSDVVTGTPGERMAVADNTWFTRSGYSFVGWNTAADGSGTSYQPGDGVVLPAAGQRVVLYAQWSAAVTPGGVTPGPATPSADHLPATGGDALAPVAIGVMALLVTAGGLLLVRSRRRSSSDEN